MDNQNVWGWVIGIIIVIIVLGGIWWAVSGNGATTGTPATGTPAGQSTDASTTGY